METMVTLLVLSVITTAFLAVFGRALKDTGTVQGRRDYLSDMRVAMERMTKQIRQATEVDTALADYIGMDTPINGQTHHVHYRVVGTTLYREMDGGASVPVLENLTTPSVFTYTTVDGTIQQVAVRLVIDTGTRTLDLESEVEMRNL